MQLRRGRKWHIHNYCLTVVYAQLSYTNTHTVYVRDTVNEESLLFYSHITRWIHGLVLFTVSLTELLICWLSPIDPNPC